MLKLTEKLRPYFTVSLILYFVAAVIGVAISQLDAAWAGNQVVQISKELIPLTNNSAIIQALLIFFHNASIQLMLIATFFLFGLPSLVFLITNGVALGVIADLSTRQQGVLKTIAALAPHGIIELPAFFFAAGIGLWLGIGMVKHFARREPFKQKLFFAIKFFVFLLLPATFIAAMIEVFITPIFIRLAS